MIYAHSQSLVSLIYRFEEVYEVCEFLEIKTLDAFKAFRKHVNFPSCRDRDEYGPLMRHALREKCLAHSAAGLTNKQLVDAVVDQMYVTMHDDLPLGWFETIVTGASVATLDRVNLEASHREWRLQNPKADAKGWKYILGKLWQTGPAYQGRLTTFRMDRKDKDEHRAQKAHQAADAAKRVAWKTLPKEEREAKIREKRDEKYAREFQSGAAENWPLGLAALAVTASCVAFGAFAFSAKGTADTATHFLRVAEGPLSQIRIAVTNFIVQATKQIGTFGDVLISMLLYFFFHTLPISATLKSIAFGFVTARLLSKDLSNTIVHVFQGDDSAGPVFQSGSKDFASLFGALFAMVAFKGNQPLQHKLTAFISRIAVLEKFAGGWDLFAEWCMKALQKCCDALFRFLGKDTIDLFNKTKDPLVQWFMRVDDLLLRTATCSDDVGSDLVDEMVCAMRDGSAYKTFYYQTRTGREIDAYLAKLSTALVPYQGSLNARNNFRIEPECAVFVGSPGIGKTMTTLFISAAVLVRSGLLPTNTTPDAIKSNIWQKGGGKYWNSYAGQHVMVMDDIWQAKGDPTDVDNEMMTLIRAVSPWSFPLEFADVASKGKNFFTSKFILATSNLESIENHARNFIHEPTAVSRRIGHPYRLYLKPQYATAEGYLDHVKYVAELDKCKLERSGINQFPWHMWEVARHDFISGITERERKPLLEVVDEIAERLAAKVRSHRDVEQTLDSFITSMSQGDPEFQSGSWWPTCFTRVRQTVKPSEAVVNFLQEFKETVDTYTVTLQSLDPWVRTFITGTTFAAGAAALYGVWCGLYRFLSTTLGGLYKAFLELLFGKKETVERSFQSNAPASPIRNVAKSTFQSGTQQVINKAYSNTYRMVLPDVGASYGHLLMLNDRLGVYPTHFDSEIRADIQSGKVTKDTLLTFLHCENPSFNVTISLGRFMSYKRHVYAGRELTFVVVADMRAHANVERNCISERSARYLYGQPVRLDVAHTTDGTPARHTYSSPSCNVLSSFQIRDELLHNVITYRALTKAGDCGGPVSLEDANNFSGGTIVGIHIAGNTRDVLGYAALLTREMVEATRKILNTMDDAFSEDMEARGVALQSGGQPFYGEGKSFLPLGQLEKPISLAPRTAYYKTEDYGIFGPFDKRPVPLSPFKVDGQVVSPLLKAIEGYGSPVMVYDPTSLCLATHVAMKKFGELTAFGAPKNIFSFEEAIKGVPELKFRAIPRGTSAGFPYTYVHKNGKHDFFGIDGEYLLDTPEALELRLRTESIIEKAKKNERSAVVFVDFPKDELRTEVKAAAGMARPISSAPLDYVVAFRQYFGAFTASFMRYHTKSGMAPGICPYSDWSQLAEHLTQHGPDVFDGDFKSFDASEQPSVHEAILDYINYWYDDGPENKQIRRVLWADLCHSRHLGGDGTDQRHVYQWNKSLPSGHPMTTVVNSMYSLILLVGCYMHLTKDMTGFWNKVYAVTYGDDNVVNVCPELASVFNQKTVSKAMKDIFGVTYTSGRKDGVLYETTTIDKVTFLKRGFFRDDDQVWNAPLELDSFLYTVYFCKNRRLEKVIRRDVLETALQELSLHTPDVWEVHAPIVYRALQRDGPPKGPLDRHAYRMIIRARDDAWY